MRKKDDKNSKKTTSRTPKKSANSVASPRKRRAKKPTTAEKGQTSGQFVRGLLVRGEAAKPTKEGKLPLDATHVITKENEDGTVEVRRVRYKAFLIIS
jgi:hypothetical protein